MPVTRMAMMRRTWILALAAAPLVVPTVARADGPTGRSCGEAYTQAQTLRNARKLVDAREALRACVQPSCKEFIVKDCTEWLDQVQQALPSIVPIANDPAGNALFDVKVSMDGTVLIEKADGRSVDVDPGAHTFTFEAADGTRIDKQVLVAEGEKSKRVIVTLGKPGAVAEGAPSAATPPPGAAPASGPVAPPAEQTSSPPWKVIGLITLGAGAVGLGVGSILGLQAVSKKNDAHCDSNSVCRNDATAATLRDAGTAANGSTIAFVVGGVLAAAGVTVWALAPAGRLQALPAVGAGSAGLVIKGLW